MKGELVVTLCKDCKSCVNGKCTDVFEPGVLYACINYLEKEDADKRDDN